MPVTSRNVHRDATVAREIISYYVGTVSATTTGIARFTMPFNARLVEIQVGASAASGTSPTLSAAAKVGATTLLSTSNLTAAGVVRATGDVAVAAGSTVTVDLTVGGTSPSFSNVCVLLVFRTAGPEFVR